MLHSLLGLDQKLMFDEVIHSHGSKKKKKKSKKGTEQKYPSSVSPLGPGPTFCLSIVSAATSLLCLCFQSFSRGLGKQHSKPADEKAQATHFTFQNPPCAPPLVAQPGTL